MRIFIAGGSGVLGRSVVPLLVADGHEVIASTRSRAKFELLEGLGATPVVVDAFDRTETLRTVDAVRPDTIIHLLTDLASGDLASNARLRTLGTANLVDAAKRCSIRRVVAESIAWVYQPGTAIATEDEPLDLDAPEPRRTTIRGVQSLESAVQGLPEGVVLRFGQLYGPGTWYSRDGRFGVQARQGSLRVTPAITPFLHVDDAARAIVLGLTWPPGVWNIVDDEPAPGAEWAPRFAMAVGAPEPPVLPGDIGRPVSNALARRHGLDLAYSSWRGGFQTL